MNIRELYAKRMPRSVGLLGAGLAGLLLVTTGCGDPKTTVSHEETASTIEAHLVAHTANLDRDLAFLDGDRRLLAELPNLDENCEQEVYDENGEFIGVEACDDVEPGSIEINFSEQKNDILNELKSALAEANIESQNDEQIVYRLNADQTCEPSEEDFDYYTPEELAQKEADCRREFPRIQPRIAVSREGAAYTFDLLIGEARMNPVDVSLKPGEARVAVDLAVFRDAMALEMEGDELDEGVQLPEEVDGVVSLILDTATAGKPQVTINIEEAVSVKGTDNDPLSVELARAVPFVTVSVETATRTLAGLLSVGGVDATAVSIFGGEVNDYGEQFGGVEKAVRYQLPGIDLGAAITLGENLTRSVSFGLGQDTSTIHIDGQQVAAIDIDPSNDRSIALDLDRTGEEGEDFILALADASNDIKIETNFEGLGELEMPEWMTREALEVSLTAIGNAIPKLRLTPESMVPMGAELRIVSRAAQMDVSITDGECLVADESVENESHPLNQMVESNICI